MELEPAYTEQHRAARLRGRLMAAAHGLGNQGVQGGAHGAQHQASAAPYTHHP